MKTFSIPDTTQAMTSPHTIFSTQEAARLCGVDRRTMLRWVNAGLLPCHQTAGGRRRILQKDLLRFMREKQIPLPTEFTEVPRVAIVDDDKLVCSAVARVVSELLPHADVRKAHDGFSAGVLVASFRPHLLFLDIIMSHINGLDVCRNIQQLEDAGDIAIVVITGHLSSALKAELSDLPIAGFISKPLTTAEIQEAVARHLPMAARS